jgi:hypothetical protein
MMGTKSKRELLTTVSPRYVTATGTDKARILDEFVATTGYHRKYAITLLRHPPAPPDHPTAPEAVHAHCATHARAALGNRGPNL